MKPDLERRLKTLRQQVYGQAEQLKYRSNAPYRPNTTNTMPLSDLTYLRQDLLKIFVLSTFALGAQIIFYLMYF